MQQKIYGDPIPFLSGSLMAASCISQSGQVQREVERQTSVRALSFAACVCVCVRHEACDYAVSTHVCTYIFMAYNVICKYITVYHVTLDHRVFNYTIYCVYIAK